MDKYLAKPTRIIGSNGIMITINELPCNSEGSDIDSTQVKALETRVYNLETTNGAINDRIDSAETTANEAKTKANAAHSIASGLQEAVGNAESAAIKAQNKATEASNQLSSISTDYENLKSRIEDLEETGGQPSIPIVGNSKMGVDSDFTDSGLNGKYYVQATWNDESRALQFHKEDNLSDVLEKMMYVTASGITSNHERITALENGSGSNSSSGNVTCNCDLTSINNTLAGHTSSIQSLDTRTGSHTASIGQLENRMTDVELQTTTNKNKIAALEASGGTITSIGDINIKSDGSSFTFIDEQDHINPEHTFKTLNEAFNLLLPFISDITKQLEEMWIRIDEIERSIY